MVTSFRYMVQTLTVMDNDWKEVVGNLRKLRRTWVQILRFLRRVGLDAHTSGHFYLKVVLTILLFRYETCVVTPRIRKTLGGFLRGVARRIT